jgi:hypothetical protein
MLDMAALGGLREVVGRPYWMPLETYNVRYFMN